MKSTGIDSVDELLSGGLPVGVVDIYGEPSSGKSAFGACLLKQAASEGRPAILIHTTPLDKDRYLELGVPGDTTIATVPDWKTLGSVFSVVIRQTENLLIVVDSASALEASANVSRALNRINYADNKTETQETIDLLGDACDETGGTVVLVSEARAVMGRINKVRSALNTDMGVTAKLSFKVAETKSAYGKVAYRKIDVLVERNRDAVPGKKTQLHVFSDAGIDRYLELLKYLISTKKVMSKGAYWVTKAGTLLGPGYERASQQLKELHEKGDSQN